MFASQHTLDSTGSRCSRCQNSSTQARRTEWLRTSCYDLVNVDGTYMRPPLGMQVHVAGGYAHLTHRLRFHTGLKLWFCFHCGVYASRQIGKLAVACDTPTATGREYLRRIAMGAWPKALSQAETFQRLGKQQALQ